MPQPFFLQIHLTSSFRKDDGRKIHGAIVKPSKISNHFVGHAIDMNVIDGSRFCNSKCLGNENKQSAGVKCFISKIRQRFAGEETFPLPILSISMTDSTCAIEISTTNYSRLFRLTVKYKTGQKAAPCSVNSVRMK